MSFHCRVCDSDRLDLALDLGNQPWGNNFLKKEEVGKEKFYPLELVFCRNCNTVQLNYTVPKEIMFADHTYLSGTTKSLSTHFQGIAQEVDRLFFKNISSKSVLDIGSNDGTLLKHFKSLGYKELGVESSKTVAEIAKSSGVNTVNEFFNLDTAQKINKKFEVINASGILFHLEELHSVLEGIKFSLKDNGVFVVQFLYLKSIVENCAFDQIYHEHLLYYTLTTLNNLLNLHGLAIFDSYLSPIHGGSMIAFVTHQEKKVKESSRFNSFLAEEQKSHINELDTYFKFAKRIERMKADNLAFLDKQKSQKKIIFGLGAPVKGNTLLNYFGIGKQYLECLTERNKLRDGLFSPGMHLPIVMEDQIEKQPDCYYVLAWNFKNEILQRNKENIKNGIDFYFPVNTEG